MSNTRSARRTALVLLALGIAACVDAPTAPAIRAPRAERPLLARSSDRDSDDYSYDARSRSGRRTLTITPGKAIYKKLGDHLLYMPADVVCDPATAGYGPRHWDAPCTVINRPIQVTATWEIVDGQTIISFTPELRFKPETSLARSVTLWAKSSRDIDLAKYYTILWFNPATQLWVDESETDPSLQAQTDRRGKFVFRRLKHFSKYKVWGGKKGHYNVTSG